VPVVVRDVKAVKVALAGARDLGDESSGDFPAFSAASMMGAPWASSAPMKSSSCPCMRWNRTQMSAWMYSMIWPIWTGRSRTEVRW